MTHTRPKQADRILQYIKDFGSITQLEAISIGCMRLASRVSELKKQGYNIEGDFVPVKNRYGELSHIKRYRLGKVG